VRPFTFFEKGVVGHVGFADPFDGKIAEVSVAIFVEIILDLTDSPDCTKMWTRFSW
jgi:hypothetical protein